MPRSALGIVIALRLHGHQPIVASIEEVTFSADSTVRYQLRLILGMLSGISVGLVLTPANLPGSLSAITPLAQAFLAGYSVELLFAAMDRLIFAFAGDERARAKRKDQPTPKTASS